jgi:hypothetical protein
MMRNEIMDGEYLQPASASGTVTGFGAAASGLVSGIRNGDIVLDVPGTEQWLRRFDELIAELKSIQVQLRVAARDIAQSHRPADEPLSSQIIRKIIDRLSGESDSFHAALDQVTTGLADIQVALGQALTAHVEADQAAADDLNRLQGGTQLG